MPEVVFENDKDGFLDRIVLHQSASAAAIRQFSGHADIVFKDDVFDSYLIDDALPAVKEAGYPDATLDGKTIHVQNIEMSVLARTLANTPIKVLADSWVDVVAGRMNIDGPSI